MTAPHVVIRADGGVGSGLGHVQRCLALAEALREVGVDVTLAVPNDASVLAVIDAAGFPASAMPPGEARTLEATRNLAAALGAAAAVVDSYDAESDALRTPLAPVTAVIDDLGDRELPVDLVISGSAYGGQLRFRVPPGAKVLAGLSFVLLRREFVQTAPHATRPQVSRVLVTLGGEDRYGLTPRIVGAVARGLPEAEIDALLGPLTGPTLDADSRNAGSRVRVHRGIRAVSDVMARADLAVSAGGQTLYELAALGVPALAIEIAPNQQGNIDALAALGSIVDAGRAADEALMDRVGTLARALATDLNRRRAMARAGRAAVDGLGARRVADVVTALSRRDGKRRSL